MQNVSDDTPGGAPEASSNRASAAAELPPTLLPEPEWRERQRTHELRVRAWTDPHQARAARGEAHPVYDFLFRYYAYRPSWLRRWHPGVGLGLLGPGAEEFLHRPSYRRAGDVVFADPSALPERRRESFAWIRTFLTAVRDRPPFFGCFGLHEWAMVYRLEPSEIRHSRWPLRLSPAEISHVVESQPICCSHFDAFRFFTAPARPLNRHQPTRETVTALEQRGCLHANMDLYKWATKLEPFAPSELIADCFALAWDIREVDMRASPYDLRAMSFPPIPVETAEGRADYERLQRGFSARGAVLRDRLISVCAAALAR